MKLLATAVLFLVASASSPAPPLQLPVQGRWFVAQGGDTINVNHHMAVPAQFFGVDLAKVGGREMRELAPGTPARVEDFFSWGAPVLAPADGRVVRVENARPDNPLGTKDANHPAGNHVVIAVAGDRYVFLAHMQRGSITVKTGDRIRQGQQLGLCGNSGNSDFPHVHLHVQTTPEMNQGQGVNPVFGPIDVELTGKRFSGVTWPLVRGLFVSNASTSR